jgi:hypothetical protein
MNTHKKKKIIFTKNYRKGEDLFTIYNISYEEMKNILSKQDNNVLSLDIELNKKMF